MRCLAESNRCSRFCRPVPNRSAKAPFPYWDCKYRDFLGKCKIKLTKHHKSLDLQIAAKLLISEISQNDIYSGTKSQNLFPNLSSKLQSGTKSQDLFPSPRENDQLNITTESESPEEEVLAHLTTYLVRCE